MSNFTSTEAQNAFRQLVQRKKDLNQLKLTLDQKRNEYATENGLGKKKLEPSILDLEKRIPQLIDEVEELTIEVRRLEVKELKNNQ